MKLLLNFMSGLRSSPDSHARVGSIDWLYGRSLSSHIRLHASRLEVAIHEGAGLRESCAPLRKVREEQMPSVDHRGPDPKRDVHACASGRAGQTHRIIEERLVRADLDQRRGKPFKSA